MSLETSGVLHSQRALILPRIGETPAALDGFGTGIGLLWTRSRSAKALTNRGMVHVGRGEGKPASADFTRAVALFQRG